MVDFPTRSDRPCQLNIRVSVIRFRPWPPVFQGPSVETLPRESSRSAHQAILWGAFIARHSRGCRLQRREGQGRVGFEKNVPAPLLIVVPRTSRPRRARANFRQRYARFGSANRTIPAPCFHHRSWNLLAPGQLESWCAAGFGTTVPYTGRPPLRNAQVQTGYPQAFLTLAWILGGPYRNGMLACASAPGAPTRLLSCAAEFATHVVIPTMRTRANRYMYRTLRIPGFFWGRTIRDRQPVRVYTVGWIFALSRNRLVGS